MRDDKIVYRVFNDFLFEYRFNVMQGKRCSSVFSRNE